VCVCVWGGGRGHGRGRTLVHKVLNGLFLAEVRGGELLVHGQEGVQQGFVGERCLHLLQLVLVELNHAPGP
jgi:hypothetical protein